MTDEPAVPGLTVAQMSDVTGVAGPIAQIKQYADLRAKGTLTTAARISLFEEHRARLHEQRADLAAQRSGVDQTVGADNHE